MMACTLTAMYPMSAFAPLPCTCLLILAAYCTCAGTKHVACCSWKLQVTMPLLHGMSA